MARALTTTYRRDFFEAAPGFAGSLGDTAETTCGAIRSDSDDWFAAEVFGAELAEPRPRDRKSTRLNSSHHSISYAVFCLKKKKNEKRGSRVSVRDERRQRRGTICVN